MHTAGSVAAFSIPTTLLKNKSGEVFIRQTNLRPTIYTLAPLLSKAMAMMKPTPVPPPVTTAMRPKGVA